MGESQSFVIGATGIGISLITVLMGWLPSWILFGSLIIASALYGTKFFATGIAGGFSSGVFTSMGWLSSWVYFTVIVLATVFLASKVASQYLNIGGTQK